MNIRSPNGVIGVSDESLHVWSLFICIVVDLLSLFPSYTCLMLLQFLELWNPFYQSSTTQSYSAHTDIITSLAGSPLGGTIASVSHDQWIKIWTWCFFVDQDTTATFFILLSKLHHYLNNELFERLYQTPTFDISFKLFCSILSFGSWYLTKCMNARLYQWLNLLVLVKPQNFHRSPATFCYSWLLFSWMIRLVSSPWIVSFLLMH